DSCLLLLLARIDLDEAGGPTALLVHLAGECAGELLAVEAFEDVEEADGLGHLVGLQGTDEMELHAGLALPQGRLFARRLLHAVLAEAAMTRFEHGGDAVRAMGLRDGHEMDVAGRPSGATGRGGDSHPDGGKARSCRVTPGLAT